MKIHPAMFFVAMLLSGCLNTVDKTHSGIDQQTTAPRAAGEEETSSAPNYPSLASTRSPSVTPTVAVENAPSETASLPPEESPINLAFVGDIMLGRSLAQRIAQGNGDSIFESVGTVLQSADLAVGNLECAVGEGGKSAGKAYTFLAPPASAAILKNAGFDLLSLANNHSLDFGTDVFHQTQNLLMENGIRFVGAGSNAVQARASVEYEIRGLRVIFLAYVEVPVEVGGFDARTWIAGESSPGISWIDDDNIISDLRILQTRADFIVVLFHFGIEGSDSVTDRQVALSHLAVDHGADLVVGSHPHLLQREENYKDRWIFYSLGDFVFDEFSGKYNQSAILWLSVARNPSVEYSLFPLLIVDGVPILGNQ
jgi:poly-gamma-glutamate capsule biosynthesis protein CapA/YwtB (metallophosphatase superfamily)